MGDGGNEPHLKRAIGLPTLVCLGAGGMIGSGIFALPAEMAAVAGPGMLLGILLAGMVAMWLALPYAELGSAFPLTGGPYALPRLAFGDMGGFLIGWGYFLYMFVGTAAILQMFVVYTSAAFPSLGLSDGQDLTTTGSIAVVIFLWAFTALNLVGVKAGGAFAVVTTIGRIIPLFIFAAWGFAVFDTDNIVPFLPSGLGGVTIATTLFFWSFAGFEEVVIPAGEVKDPGKAVPRALFFTLLLTTFVYVLVAAAFLGMVDWKALGAEPGDWSAIKDMSAPLADVAKLISPELLFIALVGGVIATGGTAGNWIMLQGRIPYAMARDRLLPAMLGKAHPKFATPFNSLIFASILTTIIVLCFRNFVVVALLAAITSLISYTAVSFALPILRKTHPEVPRPFLLRWPATMGAIGAVLATWLIYWAAWPWTLVGLFLLLVALPFYFVARGFAGLRRNAWMIVYLIGIVLMSFLGDPSFQLHNFLPFGPQGVFTTPWDSIVLTIFALLIYAWAYRANCDEPATSVTTEH